MISILETAWPQGFWAVFVFFLLVYITRRSEKREMRRDERELHYLTIIHWFIEKSDAVDIKEDSPEDIREYVIKRKTSNL